MFYLMRDNAADPQRFVKAPGDAALWTGGRWVRADAPADASPPDGLELTSQCGGQSPPSCEPGHAEGPP